MIRLVRKVQVSMSWKSHGNAKIAMFAPAKYDY
jgi:hypothetical protein